MILSLPNKKDKGIIIMMCMLQSRDVKIYVNTVIETVHLARCCIIIKTVK